MDQENNPFVQQRREQNVNKAEIEISEEQFWNALLAALLTSQLRLGPDSHVIRILKEEIHTLSLGQCRDVAAVADFVSETLGEYGGIRYYNYIGDACEKNIERLDSGGWTELWRELRKLIELREQAPKDADYATERYVATFLSEQFVGDGLHRVGSSSHGISSKFLVSRDTKSRLTHGSRTG